MSVERAVVHLSEPKPVSELAERFPSYVYPAGTEFFRSHQARLGTWWYSSNGGGRFDLESPAGTCYLAEDEVLTLLEIFGGQLAVPRYEVDARAASTITLGADIKVADLTANTGVAFGVTAEIFSTADYPLTQRWAAALRAAGFDGLRYWARHELERAGRCIALFGEAGEVHEGHHHVVKTTAALSDREDLLERWREETGVTILDVPDLL
ncbi:RES family NAD+ phosphorylase [Rhodococcoides yunnanense]|uniref:RES family NAD+ phosphorylase n=1 Tax=Rhodococcoides yunnanense TaxID=278209 RepID=UPI0022B1438C|nr:RES family NAD+ phosphorylase [Rhodococcus yunnanensis]MCZ4277743.1 RES family NAD+ phosphorylase [Rhodococcus yunnanensis]